MEEAIRYGDTVGFINESFALATPSIHDEAITDKIGQSQMRAISDNSSSTNGFSFPKDYPDRCVFKILPDENAIADNRTVHELHFGSIIKLIHEPTGHTLIASSVRHSDGLPLIQSRKKTVNCVFLRKNLSYSEESSSLWLVQSRYKVRREGDFVRLNDSIVLKSIHYKDFFLTISDHSSSVPLKNKIENTSSLDIPSLFLPCYVGITSDPSKICVSGWSIKIFRRHSSQNDNHNSFPQLNMDQRQEEKQILFTGSYIKMSLVESTGHVICRADDAKLVLSKVAPLGAISRLQTGLRTESHGVYMRCPTDASSDNEHSSLNVWQILPNFGESRDIFKKIKNGDAIRLRHIMTGQYLCVRPSTTTDAAVVRNESKISLRKNKPSLKGVSPPPSENLSHKSVDADLHLPSELQSKSIQITPPQPVTFEANTSVATTSEPDASTLFSLFSCESDVINFDENIYIGYEESVYLQHKATGCRLILHEQKAERMHTSKENVNMDSLWWEYRGDIPMQPYFDPHESKVSMLMSVNANAFRLQSVELEEVRDILFACRFFPLLRSAISSVQNHSNMVFPIYKHLCSGLYALRMWAVLKMDNEASLLEYFSPPEKKLNSSRKSSIYGASSVNSSNDTDSEPEIGEINTPDDRTRASRSNRTFTVSERILEKSTMIDNKPFRIDLDQKCHRNRETIDVTSRRRIRCRQSILADSKVLEMSLHFANIVFTLAREQDTILDNLKSSFEEDNDDLVIETESSEVIPPKRRMKEKRKGRAVPQVLIDCCVLIHDVIRASISLGNQKNALKIISIHGVLMSFMLHDIVGWKPAIEQILLSARQSTLNLGALIPFSIQKKIMSKIKKEESSTSMDVFDSMDMEGVEASEVPDSATSKLAYLSQENIASMVDQMIALRGKGYFGTSVNILKLLSVLCAPGEIPDKTPQDMIIDAIFRSPISDRPVTEYVSSKLDPSRYEPFHGLSGLLFTSRRATDGSWQVKAGPDIKLSNAARSPSTLKQDLGVEIQRRQSITSLITIEDEEGERFNPNVEILVLKDLLQDIGLVGTDLQEGVSSLVGSPISNVISWVDSHMLISNLFPTALSVEENQDMIPERTTSDDFSEGPFSISNVTSRDIRGQGRTQHGVSFEASDSPIFCGDWSYDASPGRNNVKSSSYHKRKLSQSPPEMMANPRRLDKGLLSRKIDNNEDDEDVSLGGRSVESNPFFPPHEAHQPPKNAEKDDMKSPMHSDTSGATEWIDWIDALSDVSNSEWLEKSLHLICLMCCNNTRAQRETTHLLPPELLLYLLHSRKLNAQNKTLICQLMQNIYVQNNLVFSSRATERCPIFVCEQNEKSQSHPLVSNSLFNYSRMKHAGPIPKSSPDIISGIGKVFNSYTKIRFLGSSSGAALRAQLWLFMRTEILNLQLNMGDSGEGNDDKKAYNISLLQLLRELLRKGFFDDADSFLVTHKKDHAVIEMLESTSMPFRFMNWMKKKSGEVYEGQFDVGVIQSHMVRILQDCEEQHSQSHAKGNNDLIKSPVSSINNHSVSSPTILGHISSKGLGLKKSSAVGVLENQRKIKPEIEIDINYMDDIRDHFNDAFTNKLYSASMYEIVQILTETFQVSQIRIMQSVTESFSASVSDACKGGPNDASIRALVISESLVQGIQEILENSSEAANDLAVTDKIGMTRALLIGTLHADDPLTSAVYRLLFRQLSYKTEISLLAEKVKIFPHAKESLMMQYAFYYGEATMASLTDLLESGIMSKDKESHLIRNIAFCLSHIKRILFDGEIDNAGEGEDGSKGHFLEPPKKEKPSQYLIDDRIPFLYNESDEEERKLPNYDNDGHYEKHIIEASSSFEESKSLEIMNEPLLIGDIIKKRHRKKKRVAAVGSYPISNLLLERGLRDVAPYDCSHFIEEFCLKLVRIVTKICTLKRTPGVTRFAFGIDINILKSHLKYKPWVSLVSSEKVLVDMVLNFLALVGSGSSDSAENWDAILGGIVAEYWLESEGAAKLLELLCLYCPLGGIVDHTTLVNSLVSKLLDCHIEPLPIVPRILSAILQSETQSQLQKLALNALLEANIKDLVDSELIASTIFQRRKTNRSVVNTTMHILRLIALLGRHSSTASFQRCLRESITLKAEGLMDLVSLNSTPLLMKSATLQIVQYLHDASADDLITAVFADINHIESQLVSKAQFPKRFSNLFHIRGENNMQNISNVAQPMEHPSFPSDSAVAPTADGLFDELSRCKVSCSEYLFEGALFSLTKLLLSCDPLITIDVIHIEVERMKLNVRRNKIKEGNKLPQLNLSCINPDDIYRKKGNLIDSPLSKKNTSQNFEGRIPAVWKGVTRDDDDESKVEAPCETWTGNTASPPVDLASPPTTPKAKGSKGKNDLFPKSVETNVCINTSLYDLSDQIKLNTPTSVNQKVKKSLRDFKHLFISSSKMEKGGEGVSSQESLTKENMTMDCKVNLLECTIALCNLVSIENNRLLYKVHGNFNAARCDKILELCVGVRLIFVSGKIELLIPEHARKLFEKLKVILQNFIELRTRNVIITATSKKIEIICKKRVKIAMKQAIITAIGDGGDVPIERHSYAATENASKSYKIDVKHKIRNSKNDIGMFTEALELHPPVPRHILKNSALFIVFKDLLMSATNYLESGGPILVDIDNNALRDMGSLKSKDNAALTQLSAFDFWRNGGSRYIIVCLGYITALSYSDPLTGSVSKVDNSVSCMLFHIFIMLLETNIETIRKSSQKIRTRTALVAVELERLQRSQNTLHMLGASTLIFRLLGCSSRVGKTRTLSSSIAPLALNFGSVLSTRNSLIQGAMIDIYQEAIRSSAKNKSGNEQVSLSVASIQRILKICRSHLDVVRTKGPDEISPLCLPIMIQVFGFCSMLCSGHNSRARHFLREQDWDSSVGNGGGIGCGNKRNYDIVKETAAAVNSLLAAACSIMKYVKNNYFNSSLAPLIWPSLSNAGKRRFIAWHDTTFSYFILAQLIHTAAAGFVSLTEMCQGPCVQNQKAVLIATNRCTALLEFLGAIHIEATSTIGSRFIGTQRKISLLGGYPGSFYKAILKEIPPPEFLDDAPDYIAMQKARSDWKPSLTQILVNGEYSLEGAKKNSEKIIGINLDLFKKIGKFAELSCLRMILALLEATTDNVALTIDSCLNKGIMFQNMENVYLSALKTTGKRSDYFRTAAVSYMTINMTLALCTTDAASTTPKTSNQTASMLSEWMEKQVKDGHDNNSLLASVEIIGADGQIQSVYFPVPSFVSQYWSYPEVQKAKDALIYDNSRQSPEEKIADFYTGMDGIWKVMRRQKTLKNLLSPPLHALFGGKLVGVVALYYLIPPQSVLLLILTFFLNVYYGYESYYGFNVSDDVASYMFPQFINYFWFWNYRDLFVLIIKSIHFGLAGSLAIRGIINSRAADNLPDMLPGRDVFKRDSIAYIFVSNLLNFSQAPRNLLYLAANNVYVLLFCGCSGAALFAGRIWFYVPCLVEILWQIRYMSFIVTAIRRNMLTISFTILLVVLFLYFFSVANYLFFPNQYNLSGHMSCNDIGSCFKSHLDFGINNSPDWNMIGYAQPDIVGLNQGTDAGILVSKLAGTVYNLTYTILINLVLQAIVSGLIIDTFSSMREENEAIQADIKDKCFICSLSRDEFEQAGLSFTDHILLEHNMWKYLWFKVYLDAKDPLNFTGPEHYAYSQMKERKAFVHLLPINRSLALERRMKTDSYFNAMNRNKHQSKHEQKLFPTEHELLTRAAKKS